VAAGGRVLDADGVAVAVNREALWLAAVRATAVGVAACGDADDRRLWGRLLLVMLVP